MRVTILAVMACSLFPPCAADGQTFVLRRPDPPPGASPEIVGGSKADPADWPATFVFKSADKKDCTATAVGPRVLLTAGHCITGGATGRLEDSPIGLTCKEHDWFTSGSNYDLALCLASADIVLDNDAPYESLQLSPATIRRDPVTLLGYGCTSAGGAPGVLYEGSSKVEQAAGDTRTYFETNGGAALCAGDSGGGAYRIAGPYSRHIVAVASATVPGGSSRFATVADADTIRFIKDWAGQQKNKVTGAKLEVRICGIDDLVSCHR